jgi:DNA repair photolyase
VNDLVGIAKMAAQAETLESKQRVDYHEIAARSYVAKVDGMRVPFQWGINPYRGCEFGCKYCYARYAHEFMELRDPQDFERKIFVKHFEPEILKRELKKLPLGDTIAIGTATDPYQPAERRYRVTRAMLEVFAGTSGFRLGITTKSDLVARDIDLLKEVARRHMIAIHMTVTTLDRDLARLLEPLAPRPDLRLAAVRKLSRAGICTRVGCGPIIPLLTDREPDLDRLAQAAATAGARSFGGQVLFLKPCAKQVFIPFLEERFPVLVRRYKERFDRSAYLKGDYPEQIKERLDRIRQRYGFDKKDPQPVPELWPQDRQLELFGSMS